MFIPVEKWFFTHKHYTPLLNSHLICMTIGWCTYSQKIKQFKSEPKN